MNLMDQAIMPRRWTSPLPARSGQVMRRLLGKLPRARFGHPADLSALALVRVLSDGVEPGRRSA